MSLQIEFTAINVLLGTLHLILVRITDQAISRKRISFVSDNGDGSKAQNGPGPKTFGQISEEGLAEYAKQTYSNLAQRDYDLGKFLFTVSTFSILISFTLITALGREYLFILLASIPYLLSIKTALNLVTQGAGDINFKTVLMDDYEHMKQYVNQQRKIWQKEFLAGSIIFIVLFTLVTLDKVSGSRVLKWLGFAPPEHILVAPLNTINASLQDIKNAILTPDGANGLHVAPCIADLSPLFDVISFHLITMKINKCYMGWKRSLKTQLKKALNTKINI